MGGSLPLVVLSLRMVSTKQNKGLPKIMNFNHAKNASKILESGLLPKQLIQGTIAHFIQDPAHADVMDEQVMFELKCSALKGGNASHVYGSIEIWFRSSQLEMMPSGKVYPQEIFEADFMTDSATHASIIFSLVCVGGEWGLATSEEVVDHILEK